MSGSVSAVSKAEFQQRSACSCETGSALFVGEQSLSAMIQDAGAVTAQCFPAPVCPGPSCCGCGYHGQPCIPGCNESSRVWRFVFDAIQYFQQVVHIVPLLQEFTPDVVHNRKASCQKHGKTSLLQAPQQKDSGGQRQPGGKKSQPRSWQVHLSFYAVPVQMLKPWPLCS
mmetsp:Transcript_17714/g.37082  ORF Transcript_17714/g.37082 Transcript_17714/m.37082 type:complete len:170 (+) Transcript_17714:318-827(+)